MLIGVPVMADISIMPAEETEISAPAIFCRSSRNWFPISSAERSRSLMGTRFSVTEVELSPVMLLMVPPPVV